MTIKDSEVLGLIAGGGRFPIMVARAARARGLRVIAVAHEGETDPSLADIVDQTEWIKLGQLGRLIKCLKKAGALTAVMAGTITKKKMFQDIRPDVRAISLAARLAVFHDDDILRAVTAELSREGIEIVSPTLYMPELVAPSGILSRRRPSRAEKDDMAFGWRIAKELGRLDIGQCVVVRNKTVLAVEAIEGTDETIRRGGRLAVEKAVVVKVCKPSQDTRFDLPSVGSNTIKVMEEVKASVLAFEAGKTLIFDRPEMMAEADRAGIVIASVEM